MISLNVFDKDKKIKSIGVEIFSPFVLENGKILQGEATYGYLVYLLGMQNNFYIDKVQEETLFCYIRNIKTNLLRLKKVYEKSSKPLYIQELYNIYINYYGFNYLSLFMEKLEEHLDYVDIMFNSCKDIYGVRDKTPEIINYLFYN